jgi:hypothetical protein
MTTIVERRRAAIPAVPSTGGESTAILSRVHREAVADVLAVEIVGRLLAAPPRSETDPTWETLFTLTGVALRLLGGYPSFGPIRSLYRVTVETVGRPDEAALRAAVVRILLR